MSKPNKLIIEKLDEGYLLKYQTWQGIGETKHFEYRAVTEGNLIESVTKMVVDLQSPTECLKKPKRSKVPWFGVAEDDIDDDGSEDDETYY